VLAGQLLAELASEQVTAQLGQAEHVLHTAREQLAQAQARASAVERQLEGARLGVTVAGSESRAQIANEGGELGYSLGHAYGAALDNRDLIVACVVGDGEAETGALATAWHSNKFLNPRTDGAVLPILHLNGYKIASPTVLARISRQELESLPVGYGHEPSVVEGADPRPCMSRRPPPWTPPSNGSERSSENRRPGGRPGGRAGP
jgi:hypothetical protein